ncbi:MAG: hypothetical protein M3Q58_01090 [Bacteroidota bacterium]|nr:hypothetical protein [Bacteroidota bacterium]
MEIKEKDFVKIFKNKKGMIKPALMDQHLLTGIGNVYADEILFQSKIHPKTKINELNDKKISTLYKKMQFVLKTAIKNEANPEKFPDYFLIPHRHSNQKCTVCDGSVKKIKVGGRGTYYCPKCQVLH